MARIAGRVRQSPDAWPAALSATLIAVNWVVYVWAIQNGQVYAASLGYYINPLVNVLLGTLLLGERLTRSNGSPSRLLPSVYRCSRQAR